MSSIKSYSRKHINQFQGLNHQVQFGPFLVYFRSFIDFRKRAFFLLRFYICDTKLHWSLMKISVI